MPRSSEAAPLHASDVAAYLPLPPRDYLILFALLGPARHGHAILKAIEAHADGVPFDPANLYRSLHKLERHRLVIETDDGNPRAAGPPRRCYQLTRLGRAVLAAEADRLTRLANLARAHRLLSPTRGTR
jgi:DNA-binding PadR family transcriptional regulator